MTIRKALTNIVLAGALTLGSIGCCRSRQFEVKTIKDFTGDNIPDMMLEVVSSDEKLNGRYLFIGQENGDYIKTKEYTDEIYKIIYFKTDDSITYFFDGQFYEPLLKQK